VARDATARLYGVDHDSLEFTKLRLTEKYDQATIEFRAWNGMLIDLDKLHESIWATRLSGGTRSGCISLEVTAIGVVEQTGSEIVLNIDGTDRQFVLVDDVDAKPKDPKESALPALREALERGETHVSITGYVGGWVGRWPNVLREPPEERPRLMVTGFEPVEDEQP
jgi:hypothetical protein